MLCLCTGCKLSFEMLQGVTQQPSMPSYGQRPDGSQQQGPPGVESDVPPLPMGPPPPRPPVQFRMGSMGPPPPRMHPGTQSYCFQLTCSLCCCGDEQGWGAKCQTSFTTQNGFRGCLLQEDRAESMHTAQELICEFVCPVVSNHVSC